MQPLIRYVNEVRNSFDSTAFFIATAFCSLSLWLELAVEVAEPVQITAFAVLLLPLFMLMGVVPVALLVPSWALVRHRTSPTKFSVAWFVVGAIGVSILQLLQPAPQGGADYELMDSILATLLLSAQLAACAFIYSRLALPKSSHNAAVRGGA